MTLFLIFLHNSVLCISILLFSFEFLIRLDFHVGCLKVFSNLELGFFLTLNISFTLFCMTRLDLSLYLIYDGISKNLCLDALSTLLLDDLSFFFKDLILLIYALIKSFYCFRFGSRRCFRCLRVLLTKFLRRLYLFIALTCIFTSKFLKKLFKLAYAFITKVLFDDLLNSLNNTGRNLTFL